MDENTELDNTVNYQISLPSAKDQIASAAIGVGVTFAAYALIVGGAAAYTAIRDKVSEKKTVRRAKKLAKLEASKKDLEDQE